MKRGPTAHVLETRPAKRTKQSANATVPCRAPASYRCVKRAAVRDGYDQQTSQRIGFVEVGATIHVLERRTNQNGVAVSPRTRPFSQGCRCCGKIGHLKAKCPWRNKRCDICGKEGHLSRMCTSTVQLGSTDSSAIDPKNTKAKSTIAVPARVSVEELDAEMDDYFNIANEVAGNEQQVDGSLPIGGDCGVAIMNAITATSDTYCTDALLSKQSLDADMNEYMQTRRGVDDLVDDEEEV